MKLSDVIPAVVSLVNNPNKTTEAFTWVKETIREIGGDGRWNFLIKHQTRAFPSSTYFLAKPTDCREIIDPIFYDSELSPADSWATPTAPWVFDKMGVFRLQSGDYRLSSFGIEFSSAYSSGAVWVSYYRNILLPTSSGDTNDLDLPDDFAYRLLVSGAARFGLIGEDDYDRLAYVHKEFERAKAEMRAWDSRRGIANMQKRLAGIREGNNILPAWPSNYAV